MREMEDNRRSLIEKQLLLSMICLPKDIIENEIKAYCFYDHVSGKAVKVRKTVNKLIQKACSRVNGFGYDDEIYSGNNITHWAFGFTDDISEERTQLQAENCAHCGNYVIFSNMFDTNFNHLVCECDVSSRGPNWLHTFTHNRDTGVR